MFRTVPFPNVGDNLASLAALFAHDVVCFTYIMLCTRVSTTVPGTRVVWFSATCYPVHSTTLWSVGKSTRISCARERTKLNTSSVLQSWFDHFDDWSKCFISFHLHFISSPWHHTRFSKYSCDSDCCRTRGESVLWLLSPLFSLICMFRLVLYSCCVVVLFCRTQFM
jgi:hypothetical protein